ncbi:11239_t:CDS:2 [Rhizophagus irregularis]|nr:11239_t:CDS:2 [Rhizophagus irregularis]
MSVEQAVHYWKLTVPACRKGSVEQAVHHWPLTVPACAQKKGSKCKFEQGQVYGAEDDNLNENKKRE